MLDGIALLAVRINRTSAHGNMWIYYIIIFVNRLHVSATFCVAIAMDFFYEGHITSAHGNMWIYYIIIFVNRLHVSATICVAIAMEFFTRDILQWQPNQCKGKTVPLQAYSDSEDSRRLRFPDYMITVYDGKVSLTHRPPLPPGNAPGTHFC